MVSSRRFAWLKVGHSDYSLSNCVEMIGRHGLATCYTVNRGGLGEYIVHSE